MVPLCFLACSTENISRTSSLQFASSRNCEVLSAKSTDYVHRHVDLHGVRIEFDFPRSSRQIFDRRITDGNVLFLVPAPCSPASIYRDGTPTGESLFFIAVLDFLGAPESDAQNSGYKTLDEWAKDQSQRRYIDYFPVGKREFQISNTQAVEIMFVSSDPDKSIQQTSDRTGFQTGIEHSNKLILTGIYSPNDLLGKHKQIYDRLIGSLDFK